MKIAVVTDDRETVCPHFGRATHYLVFGVEGDRIIEREIRPKAGHHTHGHEHKEEHGHGHNHTDDRHHRMVEVITDCGIVIVGGMGRGATDALKAAGIKPCSTEIQDAEEAVRACLGGAEMREPDCQTKAADSRGHR